VKSCANSASHPAPLIDDTLTRIETSQTNPDLDGFSQRLRGWIIAPQTGSYTFWITSEDNSESWLSTNKQPAGKALRRSVSGWTDTGEWTKYPSQKSATIQLTAGQENSDIMNSLTGNNTGKLPIFPRNHPRIDSAGRLLDAWGNPFVFHPVSSQQLEVRSLGPDGEIFSDDDLVADTQPPDGAQ